MSEPQTAVLFPDRGGNIHAFRAITPCAVFDVLCPPYLEGVGRDCSYFRKSSLNEPPGNFKLHRTICSYCCNTLSCSVVWFFSFASNMLALSPGDVNSSEVVWLEKLEGNQLPKGLSVTKGEYKGPIIRWESLGHIACVCIISGCRARRVLPYPQKQIKL
jgi:cysteamine dioxygenase